MKQQPLLGASQQQRLLLSFAMQQAIQVLQMPILELEDWLEQEIAENPCLEYEPVSYSKSFATAIADPKKDLDLCAQPSLFEHLISQATLLSFSEEEIKIAEHLIGSLDERGFLSSEDVLPCMEPVLKKIQLFDPPGIAARSLQESLLIQLRLKGMENTLGVTLIEQHYEDLLHNRLPLLAKKTKTTVNQVKQCIDEVIAQLNLRPGAPFFSNPTTAVIPDVILSYDEEKWNIDTNEEHLAPFRIRLDKVRDPHYLQRAKALGHAISNRKKTLLGICKYLIKKQESFLKGESQSVEPLTMQQVADELGMHISTIGRAVSQKHLFCPRGVLAMRTLFSYDLGNETSNDAAKKLLRDLIEKENKRRPLSDEALALKLSALGIPLARRTVTKYRKQQKIPSANQRRRW